MKNKKTKIISIVSLIVLALTVIGATYAYFQAQTGEGSSTDIKINANTTDVFTFETGTAIGINLDQESFASGKGNQSGTTYAKAMLTANNKKNTATEHYYLYLNISSNTFVYSQDSSKPEILLKITDKNGTEVKPTLEGIEYKTITDGNGVSQSGYDITTYNDVLPIYENKEITTTSSIAEQWNITITFINYDFNQSANAGKSLSAILMIQKSELEYALGDLNDDGKINAIEKLYFRKYFSNLMSFNKYQLKAADVNEDGVVDDIDYDIVNAVLEKKLTTLPYKNTDVYNITYNLDGGTVTDYLKTKYTSNFASNLMGVVTKENYGFTGWTGSNGDTPETNVTIAQGTTGDLNYTANWALLGDVNQDGKIRSNDKTILSRYVVGWEGYEDRITKSASDLNQDGKINFIDRDILSAYLNNLIIKLPYEVKNIYNITYDLDGGNVNYKLRDIYASEFGGEISGGVTLSKTGYTFLGWTGSNGGTPETSVTIAANTTGDLHYKANWQAN